MESILLSLPHGILLGGAYGAIAMGLSLIFGVTKITNFAHGSMLMISTFAYFGLFTLFGIDPYLGIVIVTPLMFILGYVLQAVLIKPLVIRERAEIVEPTSVMMITIGLWYAVDNLFMMLFGPNFRTIPSTISQAYFSLGDVFVTQLPRVIAFLASLLLAAALWFITNRTELGKRIRAVSQNRDASAICGIDVYKTYSIAFGIGIAAVSVAGACLSQFYFVQPQIGGVFGTKSFMIVVLGGLGSVPGALIGGLIFGIVEAVGAQFITSTSAAMLSFLLFIVMLLIRPQGLMGKK